MDANTLARIENEYSKLNESINKLGDYLLKQMNKKKEKRCQIITMNC